MRISRTCGECSRGGGGDHPVNVRSPNADTTLLTTLQDRAKRTAQMEVCTRTAAAALED